MKAFTSETITDQKRLARGEHLLAVRTHLRKRDEVHQRPWRVLMLPGQQPDEEIQSIRHMLPRAHIVAFDRDPIALQASLNAGVDQIIQGELEDYVNIEPERGYTRIFPHRGIYEQPKFDVMLLDLCANASYQTGRIASRYYEWIEPRGCMVFTFSYARDVVEVFSGAAKNSLEFADRFKDVPVGVADRIIYMFPANIIRNIRSIILYMGKGTPMCSCFINKKSLNKHDKKPEDTFLSIIKLEPGDYEVALCYPESAYLYATPQERIESLRRSHSAIIAHYTRKEQEEINGVETPRKRERKNPQLLIEDFIAHG